jgi:hypothetical protein
MDRILIAIDTYRYLTDDQTDLPGNESLHLYLTHHLSPQDWRAWNQLPVNQTAPYALVPQAGSLGPEFRQRLGLYKRAVHELIHQGAQKKSKLH